MTKIRSILPFLALSFATLPLSAMAQKGELDYDVAEIKKLLALEIEDLIIVTTVSKREESIYEAPSVISVITAEDIHRFGGQTLADIVNRMTNMHMVSSAIFSNISTSMRGASVEHIDLHALLLLNGRPIREAFTGGANMDIYTHFPLDIIERIEIMRGPGSVLYGTNSFAGSINIITKKAKGQNSLKTSLTYGSFDTKKEEITAVYDNNGFEFFGTATNMRSDGWDYELTDVTNTFDSFETKSAASQAVFNASYKGFTVNSIINKTSFHALPTIIRFPIGQHKLWRRFIDVGYEHELSSNWDINLNATYNGQNLFLSGAQVGSIKSRGVLFEATAKGRITDDINIIVGGVYDYLDGNLGVPTVEYNTRREGLYAQGDIKATNWLKLVAGFQMNQPKGIDRDISPRLAAILTMSDDWGAKLLYGQAFRSAYGSVSFTQNQFFRGNPDLEPEEIETFEAQLLYHPKNYDFSLTYYRSLMSQLHTRQVVNGATTTINGDNDITLEGIEFEGKAYLGNELELTGSLSYQSSEDESGLNDVTFSPNLMAKMGISYASDHGYTAGLFNSYYSEAGKSENTRTGVAVVNPSADAYNLMTANLEIDIPTVIKNSSMPDTKLNLFVDNVLDEDIHYPDTNRFSVNTVPQHSGRAIYARFTMEF